MDGGIHQRNATSARIMEKQLRHTLINKDEGIGLFNVMKKQAIGELRKVLVPQTITDSGSSWALVVMVASVFTMNCDANLLANRN